MANLIVVIDDDLDVRIILCDRLRMQGYEVTTAHSGRQALELLSELEGQDVAGIILDLDMPAVDGLQFLRELRRRYSSIPVIVTTEEADPKKIDRARQEGARDAVIKPIDLDALRQKCLRLFQP